MKKSSCYRGIIYAAGLLILALGLILNTKSELGVSPILSVAYSISTIFNLNFGNTTFALYALFVLGELILHRNASRSTWIMDLLQFPLSLGITRCMNLFSVWIPAPPQGFLAHLLMLLAGICCTGIGVSMSLAMCLVPNPGDGIVKAIADRIQRPVGFTKNCFDLLNACFSICLSLLLAHHLIGIGIGTILAALGVGRVITLFNHLFLEKMKSLAGIGNGENEWGRLA